MSKFEFELDRAAVGNMLRSQAAVRVCEECARSIQGRCGEGYEVTTHSGKTRANASVMAVSNEAKRDCLENNALRKAVGK